MKVTRARFFAMIRIVLMFMGILLVSMSSRSAEAYQEAGQTSDGLRMSISIVNSDKADYPSFRVALENVGQKDVTVNLGIMLANGKVQFPDRFQLDLTDSTGKVQELRLSHKGYSGIRGRVDDYVVPLRAGSAYTLLLQLDQFWAPATKVVDLKLKPGRYQISAHFTGSGVNTHNIGSEGIALMNFWKGKLESNPCVFSR